MIYEPALGFFLAWSGALIGAVFLYGISKPGSKFFISKINSKYQYDLRNIDEKHIFRVLLISRIFPVVPTPIINIGSGLSGVSFRIFTLSSALGKLPWALLYVLLGDYLIKTQNISTTIVIILGVCVFSVWGIRHYKNRLPLRSNRNPKSR